MKKAGKNISLFCLLFLALAIAGCASTAPLPATLNIVPPAPDVPKEIAAFSGVWEGKWNGLIYTILVVEKIDASKAEIIISLTEIYGYPQGGYFYATTKVLLGPTLEWIDPDGNKYTYEMDKGLKKIKGFMEEKATGAKLWTYMSRRGKK